MVRHIGLIGDDEEGNTILDINLFLAQCKYYSLHDGFDMPPGFSIVHLNARSLKNKCDEFQTFLVNSGVQWNVICVTETWFKPDLLKFYDLENYHLFASCREDGEGGGTAVYVHKKHDAKERLDISNPASECTVVEVKIKQKGCNKKILVGNIYRPPNYSDDLFLNDMETLLGKAELENSLFALAGDFNYNLNQIPLNNHALSFSNLLSSYGYVQLIYKPTRVHKTSKTLLDNIYINRTTKVLKSGVIMHDLSDHFPIFMTLNFDTSFQEQSPQHRVFDKRKMEQLNEYLMEKLQNYQMITDPNEACNILTQSYMDGIAKFSKLFKYSRRSTPLKPWITPGILCCINRKSKLYKKNA